MKLSDTGLTLLRNADFDDLGLLGTTGLGYLLDRKYVDKVKGPVISTPAAAGYVPWEFGLATADDPESGFWDLHERLVKKGFYPRHSSEAGTGTTIHPTAAIGQDGFEIHNHRRITHAGWVKIGDRCTIGAHTAVDKSLWKEPTSIGDDTHIDNLVHVAHNVQIGQRCMIVAGTVIGGSAIIGDDVFIGIGAHLRPGVHVGDGAFIGMSVTVLKDVPAGARVTCRS